MKRRSAFWGLLLALRAFAASAQSIAWDRGQDPLAQAALELGAPRTARQSVMRAFVAPSPENPALQGAAERFLSELLVRRDLKGALLAVSAEIDDRTLVPYQVLAENGHYSVPKAPEPISRAQAERLWGRALELLLRDLDEHEAPRPRSLNEAIRPVSAASEYGAEIVRKLARGARFLPLSLGPLLSFPVRGVEDLGWTGWVSAGQTKFMTKRARDKGLNLRAVVAVTREPEDRPTQIVMLWAAEPGGWKLWGLFPDSPFLPEKPGGP